MARKKDILEFIQSQVKKPTTINKALSAIRRRKKFKKISYNTFYYNVRNLILDGVIEKSETRDIHPKRKPILLINSKQS